MRSSRPFAPSFYFSSPCPASRCGTIKVWSKWGGCTPWQVRCSGGTGDQKKPEATEGVVHVSPPKVFAKMDRLLTLRCSVKRGPRSLGNAGLDQRFPALFSLRFFLVSSPRFLKEREIPGVSRSSGYA